MSNTILILIASMFIAGAVFFAVSGLLRLLLAGRRRVEERLSRHVAGRAGPSSEHSRGAFSALRREGRLDQHLAGVRLAGSWRRDLERAGLSWGTKDYLAVIVLSAALLTLAAMLLIGSALIALAGTILGAVLPVLYVKRRMAQRSARLNAQVVDAIDLVAASLRSGFGFMQSIELAAREQPEPMSGELSRMIREINLGVSTDEALERLVERTGDADLELVVTAVLIQRRVGGNLAEVLGNITHMIRERIRVRGEIKTLTAQARLSSWIIGLLPIGLGVTMTLMQPEYMSVLWTESVGRLLIGVAITLELTGFYLIRRIGSIDY